MSPASLGQLREGKDQKAARPHPPVLSLPPAKPRCRRDPQTLHPVRTQGSRRHLFPMYHSGCVPGMPVISLPPAHPARKSSAIARPGEPAESYYFLGRPAAGRRDSCYLASGRAAGSGWRPSGDS